jgi:hypothetical protein
MRNFGSGTVIALHPAKRKAKISTGIGVLVGFMVNDFDVTINSAANQASLDVKTKHATPFLLEHFSLVSV